MGGDSVWFRFRVDYAVTKNNSRESAAVIRRVSPLLHVIGLFGLYAPILYSATLSVLSETELAWAWEWIGATTPTLLAWYAWVPAVREIVRLFPSDEYGGTGVLFSHLVGVCQLMFLIVALCYALLLPIIRPRLRWQLPGIRSADSLPFLVVSSVLCAILLYLSIAVFWLGYHLASVKSVSTILAIWLLAFSPVIITLAIIVVTSVLFSALLATIVTPPEKMQPAA